MAASRTASGPRAAASESVASAKRSCGSISCVRLAGEAAGGRGSSRLGGTWGGGASFCPERKAKAETAANNKRAANSRRRRPVSGGKVAVSAAAAISSATPLGRRGLSAGERLNTERENFGKVDFVHGLARIASGPELGRRP